MAFWELELEPESSSSLAPPVADLPRSLTVAYVDGLTSK